ncbi:MAG: SDR family oxidoreductase [Chloroflexi bacterium]|nr:SDR family oxidoreductase [Chloroflexota bacterium]
MRILVAGAAGFIGSHLCDALLEDGHIVVGVDNFITGHWRNLERLNGRPGFTFVEHDIIRPLAGVEPQAIFHLASPASPVGYGRHPIETLLTNAEGTRHLLDLAVRSNARFLLASTSEAYGDPLIHPQPETYWGHVNPVGPRACYDEAKRYAEALTVNYGWTYGLDVRVIRIFNTYGPFNDPDDGRIIPNFISQALRGEPLTVYGDGRQTRSYCYVSDLVRGIQAAMFTAGTTGELFNLGNPEEYSAIEIAEAVKRLAGSCSPIMHCPPRPEEIARRRPNIDKARERLGWTPAVGLEEGLRETIAWYVSIGVSSGTAR